MCRGLQRLRKTAQEIVLRAGLATGFEFLVLIDLGAGEIIYCGTTEQTTRVGLPSYDVFKGKAVEVHHNHPRSSPLSVEDVLTAAHYEEIIRMYAHGHDGRSWGCEIKKRWGLIPALHKAVIDKGEGGFIEGLAADGLVDACGP
ncbi:MAG: hypothetical protein CMF31_08895 [Kordiimonas sp.]|nr:hypothetical protein [Kordiimonas sp.]|tara:strand:- start:9060 stop:9491 length:432 start_codon:yes stop_codon:yes gene_type:complete